MKRFTTFLLWVLLAGLTTAHAQSELAVKLASQPGVSDVTPLESCFQEKYTLFVEQPLDWNDPSAGTFRHRIFVMHAGFDRPTVVVTEGYGAKYAGNPKYREELSKLFDANIVFVEHRYFLESTPQPCDWRYLTAENSAYDLHDIVTRMKTVYPGKWIATGISKGGTTTMLYATFFPGDVDIYVPYVGPVNRSREDGRHEKFLRRVSTPADRAAIRDFQLEVLKRRDRLEPMFRRACEQEGYEFRLPLEEIYDFCVLEFSFAFWQWGSPVEQIPARTADDKTVFEYFMQTAGPSYFVKESPTTSFFVQASRELGYYGYDTKPFKKYLKIKTSRDYLSRIFLPEEARGFEFDKKLYVKMKKYLRKEDPKMAMIYGGIDPWTASGAWWAVKGKKNMKAFIQPGGSHRTRISTLPEPMREEAIELIRGWLEE